ncbi:phosphatase PAP2 family protein [Sphingomonas psychrotolerans]|uniref:Phosphatase PAP2 family protein n=1 Tax=Sphingomonas psychrotolerans TaxID=1327635 RepID=A0ABU3N3M5_9SPHN|nr:phosphatase PAP2 family protein [Sphingomonas psychrotolerans]MDT8759135.1 phosphatase PAP2 family protein [Sphingomonas psychrotolerans]
MARKKLKAPKAARRASKAERIDAAVSTELMRHRANRAVRALGWVSEAADQPPLIGASLAAIGAGAILRRPRLLRTGLRMLASELVATAIKGAVKHHINRTRPHKMLEDGRYALDTDAKGSKDEGPWNSFPSGHTAGAMAVGRAVSREYPQAAQGAGVATALVALIQLPRGKHFVSDVIAGAVIGAVSEAVVDAAARRLAGRLRRRRGADSAWEGCAPRALRFPRLAPA